jgi:hypothetical protein
LLRRRMGHRLLQRLFPFFGLKRSTVEEPVVCDASGACWVESVRRIIIDRWSKNESSSRTRNDCFKRKKKKKWQRPGGGGCVLNI